MKLRTEAVFKNSYKIYLKKSEEFLATAKYSLSKDDFNAAAGCAAHATISALDALTAFYLQRRHAGERHEDAIHLLKEGAMVKLKDKPKATKQFKMVIGRKTLAEYEQRGVFKGEAAEAVKAAERFLEWVKDNLPH
ncbi:MAG: HEPN domain-containing protein [Methanocellales archaeon]|nr:HEPN domain-containing protein [Methanocellales archaeon]